jgi:cysteine desulfurase/selenocysteine lyase
MNHRKDFPLFTREINGKKITYLDSAATSQKPHAVINAMTTYYQTSNANIHRGVYQLSQEATMLYERAHQTVASFIGARADEIIFTRGTTESLNLLAYTLLPTMKGKEIVLTDMEHHSNIVPWQQLAKLYDIPIKFIPVTDSFELDYQKAEELITERTALVSLVHVSNTLGTINDVKRIADLAHKKGAVVVVDGAQSVGHMPVNMSDLGCDFFAFSAHKMYGPTGIGVLYGRQDHLKTLTPFLYGGDMIRKVTRDASTWNDAPMKFEAGTPHIAGAVGLLAAVEYISKVGEKNINAHEQELRTYAVEKLWSIPGLSIIGPAQGAGILSFTLKGIHPHDVCSLLDDYGISARGGHHCTMPLMDALGLQGTTRISFGIYNTKEDIDAVVQALAKVQKVFA